MRIGIDVRAIFMKEAKGLKSYCQHLISNLEQIDRVNEYILFYNENDSVEEGPQLPPNFLLKQCYQKGGERFYLWEQGRLPFELRRQKIDVFHATANEGPILSTSKTILTLHDMLMFEEDASRFRGKDRIYMNMMQSLLYPRVKKIITVSEYSKKRIIQRLGVSPDVVSVVYNGISEDFRILEKSNVDEVKKKYDISDDYIFSVGANTERKNIVSLIEAYLIISSQEIIKEKLVISGISDSTRKKFEVLFPRIIHNPDIIFLPYVDRDELVGLYNGAKLFVFPSIGEGFGFPPLEAMACGTPVIASLYTSMPEILGDSAYLIDTKNSRAIADAIRLFLANETMRKEYKKKGLKRAQFFSWRRTAEQTLDIYANFFHKMR